MKFPRYGYTDMVRLQHRLVTEGLGLTRLHVVTGTSMGGMHTWVWGYLYPDFMDALVPLASNPVEIAGRNRVWRKALVDAIVTDPTWKNGDYTEPPRGLASAIGFLLMATSVPLQWQKQFPTAKAADAWLADQIALAHEEHRCQRHDLLLPRVGGLRSVAASREDHGAAPGDQLRGRLRQPAGAADDGDADQEGEARDGSC